MIDLDPRLRAPILVEALPYIQRFAGHTVVIKYGGNVLGDEAGSLASLATDLVLLAHVGIHPVLVHGGGPQIDDLARRLKVSSERRGGLRVTDDAMLEVVRLGLLGAVNPTIVRAVNQVSGAPRGVGLSGVDGGLARARVVDPSLGRVGEVVEVRADLVEALVAHGMIPIVASLAADDEGRELNVNADQFAAALAPALSATKLVFLSNVPGLLADPDDPASVVSELTLGELEDWLSSGSVRGGMVPKLAAARAALEAGVDEVHFVDGRERHALLVELLSDAGVGTMIRRSAS
ncbi:acetylglutamate kinase [Acidimicrobium ferrooxidans DSM 10331]|uniref:Acetylglutamate kinase n=1 Tax=Acidimicrobium ferrooxidans (strain DSM 10331 / JCM 15462 / NBRC 103882 / ICP) TaxID=525909 RepID=C7M0S1_ACIFD|nr:acetylglutamate kinase [Acidimicrobium ferrooxidans]ACU54579.1 acetylglutamate kinase [Acidimicrobium ferrooxidans DSM 10331]